MKQEDNNLAIPGAIVIAGIIIAGAVVFSGSGNINVESATNLTQETSGINQPAPREVTDEDHIIGNKDARVLIIEYSDTECPFCKRFHVTLQRIVSEYSDSDVAWVYRHFPIPQLHAKAETEAHATECAAELGGNDAFWAYTDRIYELTPSNDGLDLALLPEIAEEVGLDRTAFEECQESNRHALKIQADRDDAIQTGGRGTPHSLILFEDQIIPILGAQPYESVKANIDALLDS
ncbi:thioredoxin domain-containing protein [Patescibacteria group bacterium]|nr:thioredoxin domain-containing protein [Patescibacteria group bacterium]